jgi:hypothetical protein
VGTSAHADGLAHLGLVEVVSRVAAADPGLDAVPVEAVVEADRPTVALELLVAELAAADVRGKAVGVILAAAAADRLALASFELPAVHAGAGVGPRAGPTYAFLLAKEIAVEGHVVLPESLAAVDDRHPVVVAYSLRHRGFLISFSLHSIFYFALSNAKFSFLQRDLLSSYYY